MNNPSPAGDDELAMLASQLDALQVAYDAGDQEQVETILLQHPQLQKFAHVLGDLNSLGRQVATTTAAWSEPAPTPTGQTFGRYQLQQEIGRGGMGVVYRAWQAELARTVAVKMILSSKLAGPEAVKRFYAEARIAAQVRHPQIVAIHEVGDVDGQHFYAMEYVDGISLDRRLRDRKLTVQETCRLMVPIVRAVAHLHERGIVHRDLKPANLLLDPKGQLHVADFGLATLLNADARMTVSGTVLGTPAYMAPEQAAGRTREISARSDIYSLGAILYEMVAGRPAFEDESPARLLMQVIEREPLPFRKFNRAAPASLWWVVQQCMEKKPERRYSTAADLADDLERFLRGEPVEAWKGAWSQELIRVARRHPPVTYRLLAIGAALAIIVTRMILHSETRAYYRPVAWGVLFWAALVLVWEWFWQRKPRAREAISTSMIFADVALLTYMLWLTNKVDSPVIAMYHVVISAAGLSLGPTRVWLAVLASMAAYGCLLLQPPPPHVIREPHLSLLYCLSLVVCGAVASFNARRLAILQPAETSPPDAGH
jgi:predicted Ser/Thr protein kinase